MATSKNIIQQTSRDFNSITQDLVTSISNITKEWQPGDETDPGVVYLKVAAMLGDMLSYNRDRGTISMFPQTVQERQDAYRLFKSLGYNMKWYRGAKSTLTLSFTDVISGGTVIIPRYSTFQTKATGIRYCYTGDTIRVGVGNLRNSQKCFQSLVAIQGEPVLPPLIAMQTVPLVATAPWHSVYGYNVTVTDLYEDIYIKLEHTKVAEGTIVLIDDSGNEWKQVDCLADVESGRYFEMYINNYNGVYIKLAEKPSNLNVTKFKMFYVITDGKKGRISNNVFEHSPITPIYENIGSGLAKINQNVRIANTASVGGYDYETAEEARVEFARSGMNYNTLVTVQDFENDLKTVDGVDQCKVYDTESYSETHREWLFNYDGSKDHSKEIILSEDALHNKRFGKCDLWFSSVRIYCHQPNRDEDLLVFSGLYNEFFQGELTAYTLTWSKDCVPQSYTKRETSNGTYLERIETVRLNDKFCDKIKINIEKQPSTAIYPLGDYWVEYELTREPGFVGFCVVPNTENSSIVYTKEEILENIDNEIANKKHVYIEYNTDFEPYKIVWNPHGEIVLDSSVTNKEQQRLLTNIDLVLKEKFKNRLMEYNKSIQASDIYDAISTVANVKSAPYCRAEYSIPIETNTDVLMCKTPRLYDANLNKRITMNKYVTPTPVVVDGVVVGYRFNVYIGETFAMKPGSVRVSVNYNDISFTDSPVSVSKVGRTMPLFGANRGALVTTSSMILENESYVLYDTINDKIYVNSSKTIDLGDGNLSNLTFAVTPDYCDGNGAIPVQISFETTCDLFCEYNGYNPSEFYISPESIRSDF